MTERESEAANTVTKRDALAPSSLPGASRASGGPASASGRATESSRMIWVIVLTLPVTIVALAIALEIFGFLLRIG
jgi:hypothetical protein